ncbi:hypothetical protein VZT92_026127 [Zoarces viviparus]|uniref:Uncharacterized protein n=1 Tax=Zoarces viviparus TaxID=48416 RepID=A0AAW1DZ50_ZOAVI
MQSTVFSQIPVTGKMLPPCLAYNVISQQPANAACTCSAATVSDKQKATHVPVLSGPGCQASVHNRIIEIAGNWKTDAATAPERLSSATRGVPLQAGTADGLKPAGMLIRSGRAGGRIEGRFHRNARELLTSCVICEDRSAYATQRLSPLALLVFGSSFSTVKHDGEGFWHTACKKEEML